MNASFMDKWLKKYFIVIFSIVIVYVSSNLISQISLLSTDPGYAGLSKAAIFLESLSSSLLMPIFTVCILHLCNQPIISRFFIINVVLWSIYFVLLIITQFTTLIYYVSPENVYSRGPFYPVLLIPPFLILASNIIGIILRRHYLPSKMYRSLFLYLLIPLIATGLQMVSSGLFLIVLGTSISTMIIFMNIIYDQLIQNINKSNEIAKQQLAIRTLQMRPHFIYNTLTNIYYLCQQNPGKAQYAIDNFTRYLRKNFTAITAQEPIPFEEELEHAKAYLAVVKIRFEELLFVEYDIPFTAFKLPPLTLEPVVENSVKHNLDPDSSPLHIMVRTKELDDCIIITVEDTGTGYEDPDIMDSILSGDDSKDHIGLSNIKNRLEEMCSGTLDVSLRDEGGTIVTISVPKTSL
jgi:sensor histidine kinase YesM